MANAGRPDRPDPRDPARRVERMLARHGEAIARTARVHSLCEDDALDARQRALEIYLRRLPAVVEASEGAWMRVVVRREAEAIRRARRASVDLRARDFDALDPAPVTAPEDRAFHVERARRTAEALGAVAPEEARVLLLQAHGLTYEEIAERCGWSHRRVDRTLTRGRAAFMTAFRAIEEGDACERHADLLAALAGGRAGHATLVALRPHLRHCVACRATVRELVRARARSALGILLGPLAGARELLALRGADAATLLSAGGGRAAALAAAAVLGGAGLAGGWPAAPVDSRTPATAAAGAQTLRGAVARHPRERDGAAAAGRGAAAASLAAATRAAPVTTARSTPRRRLATRERTRADDRRLAAARGGEFGPERSAEPTTRARWTPERVTRAPTSASHRTAGERAAAPPNAEAWARLEARAASAP